MTIPLLIAGISLWLAVMLFAAGLASAPRLVRITRFLVCPPGCTMEIKTFSLPYHRPGERGIEIKITGPDGTRDVKAKALWVLFGMCLVLSILIVAPVVLVVVNRLP